MKKTLLILIIFPFLFTLCSDNESTLKDNDPIPSFSFDKRSIDIMYRNDETLTVKVENLDFSDLDYEIRDTFVADAYYGGRNKINITGNHIGETFLILSYGNMKDSCSIRVTPTDVIIKEPTVLDFGVDKETVKRKEEKNLLSESENSLSYEIDKYNSYDYHFKDNKLDVISRWAGSFTYSHSQSVLREMYKLVKADDGVLFQKKDLWIKLTRTQGDRSSIHYADDSKKLIKYKGVWAN